MHYLVTGGAGFIGSHLVEFLLNQGDKVTSIDNLSTGRIENIQHLFSNERFHSVVGDIMDVPLLEYHLSRCDRVFHLAAAVGVRLILDHPTETIITNVHGTENVLRLSSIYQKKVLIASTSEVYGKRMDGDPTVSSLHENDDWTLGPTTARRWAYACSKALDEFLALAYHYEKGLQIVIARLFNTIGPRQTGRYGMVVPNLTRQALSGSPLQVFGDGNQTRCFTYVDDAIRALVGLMDEPSAIGKVFNVGGGEEVSINDLAKRILDSTGSSSLIEHIPYGEAYGPGFEDMRRRTPDISRLRSTIGFERKVTLEDALNEIVNYLKSNDDA